MTQGRFEDMVRDAKEFIAAGDIFQVVLSQRFTRETSVEPFDVYRAVRRLNPSPYMFFFDFGMVDDEPLFLVGSSPEMFVRLEGRTASLRPIAGTRPRGADSNADAALAQELLADPKERAEHVMLVDLGRNDLGRVCEYGTVKVSDFFTIEKYSHVMHIVSHVEGKLRTRTDRLRSGARLLPRRDRQRRAESEGARDHLRTRTRRARRVRRHGRLLRLRRQHGHLSRHPHDGWTRERSACRQAQASSRIRIRPRNFKRP
jgi:anthranilate/para-aminobenzoate synthase component I